MDISNGLNQPVSFFSKNTGNNVNTVISEDNYPVVSNVFSPELNEILSKKNSTKPHRKSRKNKRLNTIDSEYLPDEISDENVNGTAVEENIFASYSRNNPISRLKKFWTFFIENTPLFNYFFLKQKKSRIQETVLSLNNISQNVDELLSTAVPYGEEKLLYGDIAKNLNEAANIIGKVNKEIQQ